jgi:general secretion pathway protein F
LVVGAAIALVGFVLLFGRALQDETLRLRFDRSLLRLPLVGRCCAISMPPAWRAPFHHGREPAAAAGRLKLTTQTVHNRALRQAPARSRGDPHRRQPFRRAAPRGRVPALAGLPGRSGEASGKLDVMLERAADYLEREFDTFTATALSLLEPAIIVFMGAIVALIVLSILLPILQLDTLAGGVG